MKNYCCDNVFSNFLSADVKKFYTIVCKSFTHPPCVFTSPDCISRGNVPPFLPMSAPLIHHLQHLCNYSQTDLQLLANIFATACKHLYDCSQTDLRLLTNALTTGRVNSLILKHLTFCQVVDFHIVSHFLMFYY